MAGYPEIPLVSARGGSIGNQSEISISALIDAAMCSDPGAILIRDVDYWKCLEPSTPGYVLTTQGIGAPPTWTPGGVVTSVSFTAFGATGVTTPIEVGATILGGFRTFTWSTSNDALVAANSISIADTTGGTVLGSGLANDGTHALNTPVVTNNVPATQVWTINGVNTGGGVFSRTYTVSWLWRIYAGTSANVVLTANQIKALSDSAALQSGFTGTYSFSASNYKYFCYPDSLGSVLYFRDANTGFPISMATSSDNAAYSNTANGWSYALVSVTNAQSVATNYRVYRSQYPLGGTISWIIT